MCVWYGCDNKINSLMDHIILFVYTTGTSHQTPDMKAKRDFFTVSKTIWNFSSRCEKRNSRSCQINSLLIRAIINILFPDLAFASLLNVSLLNAMFQFWILRRRFEAEDWVMTVNVAFRGLEGRRFSCKPQRAKWMASWWPIYEPSWSQLFIN